MEIQHQQSEATPDDILTSPSQHRYFSLWLVALVMVVGISVGAAIFYFSHAVPKRNNVVLSPAPSTPHPTTKA